MIHKSSSSRGIALVPRRTWLWLFVLVPVLVWACQRTEGAPELGPHAGASGSSGEGARGGDGGAPDSGGQSGGGGEANSGGVIDPGGSGGSGGSAGSDPGGEAGMGGGGGMDDDPAVIADRNAREYCALWERCFPGSLRWVYGTRENCVVRRRPFEAWLIDLPGTADRGSCAAGWRDLACEAFFEGALPEGCSNGTRQWNQPCNSPWQCETGVCYLAGYECGTCTNWTEPDTCQTSDECSGRCVAGHCAPYAELGEACESADDCAGNLVCAQRRCTVPPGTLGASCYPVLGLTCDFFQDLTCSNYNGGTCIRLPWGDCRPGSVHVCEDYGRCVNGSCVAHAADGAPCDDNDRCEEPARCISGVCQRPTDVALCGAPGSVDSDPRDCVPACDTDEPVCSTDTCVACLSGNTRCTDQGLEVCGRDATWRDALSCVADAPDCSDGECLPRPSCRGLGEDCGPVSDESCCTSAPVPGGMFYVGIDVGTHTDNGIAATVADFELDRFEVTVGRFKKFVEGYDAWRATNHPAAGEGARLGAPGSGWDAAWNANLPPDAAAFTAALQCPGHSWNDPAEIQTWPINCATWFEAFAFCIWDEGRLPSRGEWNYAASGGNEQRVYPWSEPPSASTIDDNFAVFCGSTCGLRPVGSVSPTGDGRFHQADLVGSLWEWSSDADMSGNRAILGGSFRSPPQSLFSADVSSDSPANRLVDVGLRCAHHR